jgi:hypothetical protein
MNYLIIILNKIISKVQILVFFSGSQKNTYKSYTDSTVVLTTSKAFRSEILKKKELNRFRIRMLLGFCQPLQN